jgi:hypothetical protein
LGGKEVKVYRVSFLDNDPSRQLQSEQNLPKNLFQKTDAGGNSAMIICGHDKNLSGYDLEGKTTYSAHYRGKLVVVYSGAGHPTLSETDAKSQRVLRIMREVKTEGITEDEWHEIYNLISGGKFVQHAIYPLSREYTSALSILCQGFLSAHFPQPSDAPQAVKQGLAMMGWTKFVQTGDGRRFADQACGNAEQTEDPKWWQAVCGTDKQLLLKTLEKEWGKEGPPDEVSQLVRVIFGKSNLEKKKAEVVARGYLKLAERLNQGIS